MRTKKATTMTMTTTMTRPVPPGALRLPLVVARVLEEYVQAAVGRAPVCLS